MHLMAEQIRAARALLGWTRQQLAEASGVAPRTLAGLELGETQARAATAAKIRKALEEAGVRITARGVERIGGRRS
jgi:transcriptional regulator with XRE-family HTH domain